MLRSDQISTRSRRILTRSGRILTRSHRISKRSGHFSTDWTKTTGETLPSTKNDDFFRCNTVESVFFFSVFMFRPVNRPTGLRFWRRRPAVDPSPVSGRPGGSVRRLVLTPLLLTVDFTNCEKKIYIRNMIYFPDRSFHL